MNIPVLEFWREKVETPTERDAMTLFKGDRVRTRFYCTASLICDDERRSIISSPCPHIFSDAVLRLSFAPDDKHRLACCSKDSNLSVFDLGAYPPYLNTTLAGHTGPVR